MLLTKQAAFPKRSGDVKLVFAHGSDVQCPICLPSTWEQGAKISPATVGYSAVGLELVSDELSACVHGG